MYVGNDTLLFTTEGKSKSLQQWHNISIDVYEQVPFKLVLEANFTGRNNDAILVDETSIAYRPCQGKHKQELILVKTLTKTNRDSVP